MGDFFIDLFNFTLILSWLFLACFSYRPVTVVVIGRPVKLTQLIMDKENTNKPKGAALVIYVLKEHNVEVIADQFGEAYAIMDGDGATMMPINSEEFHNWIFSKFYEKGLATSEASVKDASKILKHKALKQSRMNLQVRVAKFNEKILYDLGNKKYVEITKEGWSIRSTHQPPVFKRFAHQKPQVMPVAGGTIDQFFDLINLPDAGLRLLLKVYLVASCIPEFAHPVLMVYGTQGSAKTTMCALLKDLVDPSALETSGLVSENEKELVQTASHHWMLVLDNLTYISEKISDLLSRICTGGGLSKRVLYQNDSDYIYNFKHIIVLNGITQVIHKPDLLDRALLIRLERIPDDKRATMKTIMEQFEQMKPSLLGAIFDAVSKAMYYHDQIQLDSLPRMADFAQWGCAIAKALGEDPQDFIKAYQQNVMLQTEEAIDNSPLADAIKVFMNGAYLWKGTPTELFLKLRSIAEDHKIENSPGWPRSPQALGRKLSELKPNLGLIGYDIETGGKDEKGNRQIVIQNNTNLDRKTEGGTSPSIDEPFTIDF